MVNDTLPEGVREYPVACLCGAKMHLKPSRFGLFYGCSRWPECDVTHGCHKATGEPLGKPADKSTREARIAAHAAFDRLWKGEEAAMNRQRAYEWMRTALSIPWDEAHISMFDEDLCRRLVHLVTEYFDGV